MSPVPEAVAGWAQSHFWGINGLLLRAVSTAAVPELPPQTLFPLRVPAVFVAVAAVAAVRATAAAAREVLGVMAAAAAAAAQREASQVAAAALAGVAL
jgi:hypothetical protein